MQEINTDQIVKNAKNFEKFVVLFYNEECSTCDIVLKHLLDIENSRDDDTIKFYKVNTDKKENQDFTDIMNVKTTPYLMFFQNRSNVINHIGLLTKKRINYYLDKLL
jgi:thiol-disulfide isomerase/thioredoxin